MITQEIIVKLIESLRTAIVIIESEYPKNDPRHQEMLKMQEVYKDATGEYVEL